MSVYWKEQPTYLEQALDSVFKQSVKPTEVVVVKDGPLTPELDEVIDDFYSKHNELKVVALPENVGLGAALNEGLKYCSCELVARMDSDDISKPNRFEKQLEAFNNNTDIDVVGSWVDEFQGKITNILSVRKLPTSGDELYGYAQKRCPLNHPTVMFRKTSIEAVGGYKHFYLFEDYYLWVRLLINGYHLYNIQESLLYFRTSYDMLARRGGFKYAMSEVALFREMYKIGFIKRFVFFKNVAIRFPIRLMPNKIRRLVYQYLLR